MKRKRYQRRVSRPAVWSRRLAVFSAVLLVLSGIGHRFQYIESPDLIYLALTSALLALVAFLLAIWGISDLWRDGAKGGVRSTLGASIACCILVPVAAIGWQWQRSPALFDITTDFDMPPQFGVLEHRTVRMNRLNASMPGNVLGQISAYPDVVGRRYNASPDRVLKAAEAALSALDWRSIAKQGVEGGDAQITLTAMAISSILGLKSDVAIRLMDEGETTVVDMRAASRYGNHDLGVNARFITAFMAALEREMNEVPGNPE